MLIIVVLSNRYYKGNDMASLLLNTISRLISSWLALAIGESLGRKVLLAEGVHNTSPSMAEKLILELEIICKDLRDRVVDGGLVRLTYGMD